jgi:hypothetical protein
MSAGSWSMLGGYGPEEGYVGYGGFRVLNNSMIGNFLFKRSLEKHPRSKQVVESNTMPSLTGS